MRYDLSRLCYIDARHVECGSGNLDGLDVRDAAGERIGILGGLVIDPSTRRVRYFVVDAPGWLARRRYLLPLCPARLDGGSHALRVDPDRRTRCLEFDAAKLRRF